MKNHKMFLIWLVLLMVTIGYAPAIAQPVAKPNPFHPGYGPSKITLSKEPKIGEVVTLTYIITSKADVPNARVKLVAVNGGEFIRGTGQAKVINKKLAYAYYPAKNNKTESISVNVRITYSPLRITAYAAPFEKDKDGKEYDGLPFGISSISMLVGKKLRNIKRLNTITMPAMVHLPKSHKLVL